MKPLSLFDDDYFNPSPSYIMHIDLNSCFATVEQQANPLIRGKPVAVAAYTTARGCIIAPSVEAKKKGIKLGMRVFEGRKICPDLIVLEPDPWKYRFVNRRLLNLFRKYTDKVSIKSIDEMVLDLNNTPCIKKQSAIQIGKQIKKKIKQEIGDWLTVSIGIAPNRFLAKTASNLHKPDGLKKINRHNFYKIYQNLKVQNLCGIKRQTQQKLNTARIFTVAHMYDASAQKLKSVFNSITGYYWYLRLRGQEVDIADFKRKSFGNSYALHKFTADKKELGKILYHLVEKTGYRLRRKKYSARGINLSLIYTDYSYWHRSKTLNPKTQKKLGIKKRINSAGIYASNDIFKQVKKLLYQAPYKKVRIISVSCFNLKKNQLNQLTLLEDEKKKRCLTAALDKLIKRFGSFAVFAADTMTTKNQILDRIAFGSIKELEEFSTDYFTSKAPSSVQ